MWNIHHVESNIQDKRMRQMTMFPNLPNYICGRVADVSLSWDSVGEGGRMPMLAPLVTVLVELEGVRS